jgi:hypothetical protein
MKFCKYGVAVAAAVSYVLWNNAGASGVTDRQRNETPKPTANLMKDDVRSCAQEISDGFERSKNTARNAIAWARALIGDQDLGQSDPSLDAAAGGAPNFGMAHVGTLDMVTKGRATIRADGVTNECILMICSSENAGARSESVQAAVFGTRRFEDSKVRMSACIFNVIMMTAPLGQSTDKSWNHFIQLLHRMSHKLPRK